MYRGLELGLVPMRRMVEDGVEELKWDWGCSITGMRIKYSEYEGEIGIV